MRLPVRSTLSLFQLLFAVFCMIPFGTINAQTTISAIGNPSESARFPIENGFINLGNGNVHLEIPIASYPQRGDLSVSAKFVYDSSIWQVVNSPTPVRPEWYPATVAGTGEYASNVYGGLGWTFQYGRYYAGAATPTSHTCPTSSSLDDVIVYTNIQWADTQGTLHAFPITTTSVGNCTGSGYTDTPSGQGWAVDASGYYATVTNYTTLQIWDPKGTQVVNMSISGNGESGNPTIDRNGNYISYNQQGSITDDSLQHPNITESVTSTDQFGNPASATLSVPIAQGQTATYTITYENIPVNTDFNVSGSTWGYGGNVEEFLGSINVIESIALPDGSSYQFQYDQCTPGFETLCGDTAYGELKQVTLPHGGTVNFGYQSDANAGSTEPARWVNSHSGSDGLTTFQYSYVGNYSPTSETGGATCKEVKNTATSATLQSAYIFSNCNGNILPMKVLFSPVSNTSAVDAFTLFQYDFTHACQNGACTGSQWTNLLGKTTVIPTSGTYNSILSGSSGTGLITDIQYVYATPGSGIATSVKQWDYHSGTYPTSLPPSYAPPGSPTRETDQQLNKTVNYALFPTQKTITNSTGSTTFTYTYDEAAYTGTSAPGTTTNHNESLAASSPGNLTTVSECCAIVNSASVTLAKHYYYDNAGSVIQAQDPNGHNTISAYDSTDTYAQTITAPPTTGSGGASITHITKPVYDFNTGQIASYTDQNNQLTTYNYDTVGRLWTVMFGSVGSQITLKTITYPSANEADVAELQSQGVNVSSSSIVDGYGRPYQSIQGGITSTTNYDAQGRKWTVTNPEASVAYSTDGTTTYGYDELNRVTSVEMPNSNKVLYSYSGNTATIADPSGHSSQQVYDAFGDLTEVLEPSAAGTPNWLTAWTTTYGYNGLGLLTSISQNGGTTASSSSRIRSFNYDGAGRLQNQTTPEEGTYTYGYDNNGNLTSSTNSNTTNNNVSYSYDADNRMYQEVIAGGPTYTYTYDAQDSSGDQYGIGRLTGSSNGSNVQTVVTHDAMGDVVSSKYCLPSDSSCTFAHQVQAQYDYQGNLTYLTYPDGRQINWTYDLLNRPVAEAYSAWNSTPVNTPYVSNINYYPAGELQSASYGNGTQVGATFDPDQNLSSLLYMGNGVPLSAKVYTWDMNAQNLLSIVDGSAGRKQTFSYDQLNRLQSATDTGTTSTACLASPPSYPSWSESYSADAWGNLQETGSFTFNQLIGTSNRITETGYVYDSAGNMTNDGLLNTYQYRADGLMSGSNGATYTYDASGQRVQKVASGTTTEYIYFGGQLLAMYNPSTAAWTDRIYGPGGALATVAGTQNAVPVYRIGDHLGSLALSSTTDTFSGVTGIASTLPFGETAVNSGGDNFPFTDHERDSENGADATMFRHYSPAQSRWLSPDPYNGSYDISDPQSLNRYAYLTNRPMNATDPLGLQNCIVAGGITGCSGGGGSDPNAPIDDSGNPSSGGGGGYGGSGIVSGLYAGGGAYGGNYSPMTSSYSAPGAYIQADWTQSMLDTHSASEEFAANLIFPFETFGETLDNFRQQNYWKATGYALLTLPGLIPDVGAEEKTALTAGDQVLARTNGIREGIYEFISSNGQKYIGQSGNIYSRLMQHIQQGKLAIQDIDSIVAKEVLGGKTAREIEEQLSILRNGRIPNLRNQVNPIGAARGNLLPQWAKSILGYK